MKKLCYLIAGLVLTTSLVFVMSGCHIETDSHEHTFAANYSNDETYHWYAATCEHTTEVKGMLVHNFGEWKIILDPSEESEGVKEKECSDCHYKVEESIEKLGHSFDTVYSSDATHHWYASTCAHVDEVKDKEEHSFGDYVSNDNVAADLYGTKTRTCSVCGYADTVPDYSLCKVGDIILKDGTICSIEDYITDSNTAAAVIVRAASKEKPAIGVGIVRYGSQYMQWCSENAIGRKEISGLNPADGSGAWEILKKKCSDAENHPEYYPAWNYSLKYAETNNLEGYLAEGWYLPSLAELKTISKNKTTIDTSLLKVGKEGFGSRTYWSCCQSGSASNFALLLNFDNGSSEDFYKNNATNYYCVCSIKAFN